MVDLTPVRLTITLNVNVLITSVKKQRLSDWILFIYFKNLFIYFWPHWVFTAVPGLSLVAESSRHVGFSSCGSWA